MNRNKVVKQIESVLKEAYPHKTFKASVSDDYDDISVYLIKKRWPFNRKIRVAIIDSSLVVTNFGLCNKKFRNTIVDVINAHRQNYYGHAMPSYPVTGLALPSVDVFLDEPETKPEEIICSRCRRQLDSDDVELGGAL